MRGNQAGLSTFHFSYKEKVFQGTFSEQKPPPKREGSCSKDAMGVQTAQICCSQLHPLCTTDRNIARAAHLLTLGQPNTTGLSLVRQNHSPAHAMQVSHRKQVPYQRELWAPPQKAPAAIPVGTPAAKGLTCSHWWLHFSSIPEEVARPGSIWG